MTYIRLGTTPAQKAGRFSLAFAGASLVMLLLLHFVRPDLDPLNRVLSEYSLGDSGWLGRAWFFMLALACASLCFGLVKSVNSIFETVGAALLSLGVINLVLAGIFPMDAAGAIQPTTSGIIHGIAGMIGISSLILSSLILGWTLGKRTQWAYVRTPLVIFSLATLVADIGMTAAAISSGFGQQGGPSEANLLGLWNRLLMISFTGWVMTASSALWRGSSDYAASPELAILTESLGPGPTR